MPTARALARAALSALQPEPLPAQPAAPVERALSLGGLALLAVPLSGATAVITRLPPDAALVVTGVALATWAALMWSRLGRRQAPGWSWLAALVFCAGAFGHAVHELWTPYFGGFPGMGGGDGGNHIALEHIFAGGHPEVYQGMQSLAATALWIERVSGGDAFTAYRTVFYVIVATLIGFVALLTLLGSGRRAPLAFLALVGVAAYPATRALLPLVHYYQCDGFWSQLMGLVPLVVGVGLYATARHRAARLLALAFTLAFYRYTYLLNVGELLLTSCALVAIEAAPLAARLRRGLRGAALAGAAAAVFLYQQLYAIAHLPGGVHGDRPQSLALASVLLAALLLSAPAWFGWAGVALPDAARRGFRFAGLFGGAGAIVTLVYALADGKMTYYFVKFPVDGAIVVALAAQAMLATLLAARPRAFVGLALAIGVAGGDLLLAHATVQYRASYLERSAGTPPFETLVTQAEPVVWQEIRRALDGRRRFGGLLTPRWPESQLTNAAFGLPLFFIDPFHKGEVVDWPGTCVFWDPAGWALVRWYSTAAAKVEQLNLDPRKECRAYAPVEAPEHERNICHVCSAERSLVIPLGRDAGLAGFYPLDPQFPTLGRWTDGDATVTLGLALTGRCSLRLVVAPGRTPALRFDGVALTAVGGVYPLGAPAPGAHVLEIRSDTAVEPGTQRRLGVKVRQLAIDCD